MLARSCGLVVNLLSAMGLKLVMVQNKRKTIVVIFTILLAIFIPLALFSRWSTVTVTRTKGKILKLRLEDLFNPVRVSLVPVKMSLAVTESDNSSAVPNVVHYVWLGTDLTFTFINYLSFKSVDRFIQPRFIYVYGEVVPTSFWWKRVISEIGNIYHVHVDAPNFAPNGQRFKYMAHKSDFLRFNLLSHVGGIYLDSDVLALQSFDPLRQYDMVLGREQPEALCNGIIIASRGAPFLQLILELYNSYSGDNEEWGYRANRMPHQLALRHPNSIHIEETSLNRPNWKESRLIYDDLYNWRSNFAMHLWVRKWPKQYVPRELKDVRTANTTIGEMARWILYGSSEPLRS